MKNRENLKTWNKCNKITFVFNRNKYADTDIISDSRKTIAIKANFLFLVKIEQILRIKIRTKSARIEYGKCDK